MGVIVAAGRGERMGTPVHKPFLPLGDKPVLAYTLLAFEKSPLIDGYYVVIHPGDDVLFQRRVSLAGPFVKLLGLVDGGRSRRESVFNGLRRLDPDSTDFVVIHDGVRPFVTPELLESTIRAARHHGAAVPVLPVKDTIKEVGTAFVAKTLERGSLRAAQTPQVFSYPVIMRAHRLAMQQEFAATDDAQLVEQVGRRVATVPGDPLNIKLTTPEDLESAEHFLSGAPATPEEEHAASEPVAIEATASKSLPLRVGMGYDAHALVLGRPLVLGGVKLAHRLGLDGHSDADVVTHAVIDALLGAAALGDIGRHFPSSDEHYRNVDSLKLLAVTTDILKSAGWRPVQVDATVIAQAPRLSPFINEMKRNLASTLKLDTDRVSVKATTTDRLGFVGREEGIAANAIVQVAPTDSDTTPGA